MSVRVVYWNNIPAPYMVDRFNAVARRGNLDLQAWFSARTEEGRSWAVDENAWEFRSRYLPGARGRLHGFVLPPPLLRSGPVPDVLVSLYAGPAYLAGSELAKARGARTAFWVEPTGDLVTQRRWWKERLKSRVLPRADGILTTGDDGRAFVRRYPVDEARVFVVPHVIEAGRYAADDTQRGRDRAALGLHGPTFVYVGKLSREKGLDHLLDAFAKLVAEDSPDASLLLVGDGVDEARLRERALREGLDGVVFAGFRGAGELAGIYGASDVFVFPTLGDTFGLVVSEAMAAGLPVISTSAAGEIRDRVVEGENGFLVPPADSGALHERMKALAASDELRLRMGALSRSRMEGESPDRWAAAFERAVLGILDLPTV